MTTAMEYRPDQSPDRATDKKTAISIIVVSYNTRKMTLECLRSVFEQTMDCAFEVIVVDNASTDGSAKAVAAEFPQVRLIESSANLGFAAANNVAVKQAHGEFILLLNPDTVVLDQAIDRLLGFALAHPDAGIWGGRTVFEDGTLNPTSCWRFMSLWSLLMQATGMTTLGRNTSLLNPEAYGGWQRDNVREVDIVTGCLLLIRRELWIRLCGFDESFFMYVEEAELCYRARQQGARPIFTPDATIIHYDGASETVHSRKMIQLLSGKVKFLNKHWARPSRSLAISLLKIPVLAKAVIYSMAASVTGSAQHNSNASEWWAIWRAREHWARGNYPSAVRPK